ncbi:MAG: hypothetical protein AAGU14_09450 [Eubacteriaceae bacterium]
MEIVYVVLGLIVIGAIILFSKVFKGRNTNFNAWDNYQEFRSVSKEEVVGLCNNTATLISHCYRLYSTPYALQSNVDRQSAAGITITGAECHACIDYGDEQKICILKKACSNLNSESPSFSDMSKICIDYSKIIKYSIRINEISVQSTDIAGALGGAIVGGLLAGGAGAIVGSSLANKQSVQHIKELSIQLTVDDLSKPFHEIYLLKEAVAINKDYVSGVIKSADSFTSKLELIMQKNKVSYS